MARKKKQLDLPHVPPGKKSKEGNPFVAFRVPPPLLSAFLKKHGGRREAMVALRRHMQAVTR